MRILVIAHLRYDFDPARAQAHIARSLRVIEREVGRDHPTVDLHLAGLAATHLATGGPTPSPDGSSRSSSGCSIPATRTSC